MGFNFYMQILNIMGDSTAIAVCKFYVDKRLKNRFLHLKSVKESVNSLK
jgi:hypothetical protein